MSGKQKGGRNADALRRRWEYRLKETGYTDGTTGGAVSSFFTDAESHGSRARPSLPSIFSVWTGKQHKQNHEAGIAGFLIY